MFGKSSEDLLIDLECVGLPPKELNEHVTLDALAGKDTMKSKGQTDKPIWTKLRRTEELPAGGKTVQDAVKDIEFTQVIYYRWKKQFGGFEKAELHPIEGRDARHRTVRLSTRSTSDVL